MKDFVFIIALTPKEFLTETKTKLFELTIESLKSQVSDNWQALLIGDEDFETGNLIYLKSEAKKKGDKILFALSYIEKQNKKPKYLIRFDDDDLISSTVVNAIEKLNFDCYADKYHTYYNLINGKISFLKANFMANSVFHKYEHAIKIVDHPKEENDINKPLIACDHALEFIRYYKDKNIIYSPRKQPLYLRILSPASVTMGILDEKSRAKFDIDDFNQKSKEFGFWQKFWLSDYKKYFQKLNKITNDIYGIQIDGDFSYFTNIKGELDYYLFFFRQKLNRLMNRF